MMGKKTGKVVIFSDGQSFQDVFMEMLAFVDDERLPRHEQLVTNVVSHFVPGGRPHSDQYGDSKSSYGDRDNERQLAANADVVKVTEQRIGKLLSDCLPYLKVRFRHGKFQVEPGLSTTDVLAPTNQSW